MRLTIQHEDDLLTVIDRLLAVPDADISIEIPDGSRLLSSEENFLLLKREMDAAGKRLRVRAFDPRARTLATRAGIALDNEGLSQAGTPRRFSDILPPQHSYISQSTASKPDSIPTPPKAVSQPIEGGKVEASRLPKRKKTLTEIPKKVSEIPAVSDEAIPLLEVYSDNSRWRLPKLSIPKLPFLHAGSRRLEIGLIAGALIVFFLVANEVLPAVDVRIRPRTEAVTLSFPAIIQVGSAAQGNIQGQKISVQASEERNVPASGSAEVTARAGGIITIYNAFSSASQTLVANTRFVSQDGKLFRLHETTVVPGATVEGGQITPSSTDARVTADEAGPEYNIGPSSFSIPGFQGTPKFTAFTAKSTQPMTGGAKGTVKIVTAEDVTKAQDGLSDVVAKKLDELFAKQVPQDLKILQDATVENIAVNTDVAAGDHADAVVARAEGTRTVLAFRDEDLRAKTQELLKERIPNTTEIVPSKIVLTPTVKSRDLDKGTVRLDVAVEAQAAWAIDVEKVRDALVGKREGEIRGWLVDQEAIETATVRFSPFWVRAAPKNRKRVRVHIELEGAGQQDRTEALLDHATAKLFS